MNATQQQPQIQIRVRLCIIKTIQHYVYPYIRYLCKARERDAQVVDEMIDFNRKQIASQTETKDR